MDSRASQVEALLIQAAANLVQVFLDQSVRDGQVCKRRPSKLLLEGEALLQLLLWILTVVDQSPKSCPDVPGFARLLEEEFETLCQQGCADFIKGRPVVPGNPGREDDIVVCYLKSLEGI